MPTSTPIHPLLVQKWLTAVITDPAYGVDKYFADNSIDIAINGRVYPRRGAPRAEQTADTTLWPLVSYHRNGNATFDNYGERPLIKTEVYLVTFVMFWPSLPANDSTSLESYCALGAQALQNAFASPPPVTVSEGTIHSSVLLQEVGPMTDGPEEFETCEFGYMIRLMAN